jgi:hypothetical protein
MLPIRGLKVFEVVTVYGIILVDFFTEYYEGCTNEQMRNVVG